VSVTQAIHRREAAKQRRLKEQQLLTECLEAWTRATQGTAEARRNWGVFWDAMQAVLRQQRVFAALKEYRLGKEFVEEAWHRTPKSGYQEHGMCMLPAHDVYMHRIDLDSEVPSHEYADRPASAKSSLSTSRNVYSHRAAHRNVHADSEEEATEEYASSSQDHDDDEDGDYDDVQSDQGVRGAVYVIENKPESISSGLYSKHSDNSKAYRSRDRALSMILSAKAPTSTPQAEVTRLEQEIQLHRERDAMRLAQLGYRRASSSRHDTEEDALTRHSRVTRPAADVDYFREDKAADYHQESLGRATRPSAIIQFPSPSDHSGMPAQPLESRSYSTTRQAYYLTPRSDDTRKLSFRLPETEPAGSAAQDTLVRQSTSVRLHSPSISQSPSPIRNLSSLSASALTTSGLRNAGGRQHEEPEGTSTAMPYFAGQASDDMRMHLAGAITSDVKKPPRLFKGDLSVHILENTRARELSPEEERNDVAMRMLSSAVAEAERRMRDQHMYVVGSEHSHIVKLSCLDSKSTSVCMR
jgi:hypothetical protein